MQVPFVRRKTTSQSVCFILVDEASSNLTVSVLTAPIHSIARRHGHLTLTREYTAKGCCGIVKYHIRGDRVLVRRHVASSLYRAQDLRHAIVFQLIARSFWVSPIHQTIARTLRFALDITINCSTVSAFSRTGLFLLRGKLLRDLVLHYPFLSDVCSRLLTNFSHI